MITAIRITLWQHATSQDTCTLEISTSVIIVLHYVLKNNVTNNQYGSLYHKNRKIGKSNKIHMYWIDVTLY